MQLNLLTTFLTFLGLLSFQCWIQPSNCLQSPPKDNSVTVRTKLLTPIRSPDLSDSHYTPSIVQWTDDQTDLILDTAATAGPILVEIVQWSSKPKFTLDIYCHVKPLLQAYGIDSFELCYKRNITNIPTERCSALKASADLNVDVNRTIPDSVKGVFLRLEQDIRHRKSFSGFYQVQLKNLMGSIRCAQVQVVDLDWESRLLLPDIPPMQTDYENVTHPIEPKHLPLTYSCVPKHSPTKLRAANLSAETWMRMKSSFVWYAMPNNLVIGKDNIVPCGSDVGTLCSMSTWFDYYIAPDGDLTLYSMKFHSDIELSLFCHDISSSWTSMLHGVVGNTHVDKDSTIHVTDGVLFKPNGQTFDQPAKILSTSPPEQKRFFYLHEGNFTMKSTRTLWVTYQARPSTNGKWTKDNAPVPSSFEVGPNYLVFPESISTEAAHGTYKFEIDNDSVTFTVCVRAAPHSRATGSDMHDVETIIMSGDFVNLTFYTDNQIHQDAGQQILLNGDVKLNVPFNQPMSATVYAGFKGLRLTPTNEMTTQWNVRANEDTKGNMWYSAGPLTKIENTPSHSHTVTLRVYSPLGESAVHKVIKVLPQFRMQKPLSDNACSRGPCDTTKTPSFHCEFNAHEYHEEGALVMRFWNFEGHWIPSAPRKYNATTTVDQVSSSNVMSSLSQFFWLENDNEVLVMDNAKLFKNDEYFHGKQVECRVLILKAAAGPLLKSQINSTTSDTEMELLDKMRSNEFLIFDSQSDENLRQNYLIAKIKLHSVAKGSIMGAIVGVCLAIFALILILLMVLMLVKKPKTTTYEVEKKEIAHGLDPVGESRSQTFHTYDREDHEEKQYPSTPLFKAPSLPIPFAGISDAITSDDNESDDLNTAYGSGASNSRPYYPVSQIDGDHVSTDV